MVADTLRTINGIVNELPNFPVYLAFIMPGLCVWAVIWVRGKWDQPPP